MPMFVTPVDLATWLQRDFTAEETATVEQLLEVVSGAIRSYTGQDIDTATTTRRLKVKGYKVRLPQGPVTAVSAVTSTAGAALTFTWFSGPTVWVSSPTVVTTADIYDGPAYVDVTYTHGYATPPDDIKAITLQVAGRALGAAADQTGGQESIGSYSYSIGAAAAQGAVGFLLGERMALDRYKVPAGPIAMERA